MTKPHRSLQDKGIPDTIQKSRKREVSLTAQGFEGRRCLLVAAAGVDLEIAGADGDGGDVQGVGRVGADEHQTGAAGAVEDIEVEAVLCGAGFTVIFSMAHEADRGLGHGIGAKTGEGAGSHEVDGVDIDFGGFIGGTAATDHGNVKSFEVEAVAVIHHIPVSASGGGGAAARIDDAAITEVGLAFGFADRAATGEPARSLRGGWRAERAAEGEVDAGKGVVIIDTELDTTANGGAGGEAGGIDADGVGAGGVGQLQQVGAVTGGGGRADATDGDDNT